MTLPQYQRQGYGRFLIDFSKFANAFMSKVDYFLSEGGLWMDSSKFIIISTENVENNQQ